MASSTAAGPAHYETVKYTDYLTKLDKAALDSQRYTHGRRAGSTSEDITSFLDSQKDWAEAREHRPAILFQLYRINKHTTPEPPKLLYHDPTGDGKAKLVVSDVDGSAIMDFPELPIQISSKVEGWLLETWFRMMPSLQYEDIMDRMVPPQPMAGRKKLKSNMVEARRSFRVKGRCYSWAANVNHNTVVDRKLRADLDAMPRCRAENTTKYLEDLAPKDILKMKVETQEHGKKGKKRARQDDMEEEATTEVRVRKEARTMAPTETYDVLTVAPTYPSSNNPGPRMIAPTDEYGVLPMASTYPSVVNYGSQFMTPAEDYGVLPVAPSTYHSVNSFAQMPFTTSNMLSPYFTSYNTMSRTPYLGSVQDMQNDFSIWFPDPATRT